MWTHDGDDGDDETMRLRGHGSRLACLSFYLFFFLAFAHTNPILSILSYAIGFRVSC